MKDELCVIDKERRRNVALKICLNFWDNIQNLLRVQVHEAELVKDLITKVHCLAVCSFVPCLSHLNQTVAFHLKFAAHCFYSVSKILTAITLMQEDRAVSLRKWTSVNHFYQKRKYESGRDTRKKNGSYNLPILCLHCTETELGRVPGIK